MLKEKEKKKLKKKDHEEKTIGKGERESTNDSFHLRKRHV